MRTKAILTGMALAISVQMTVWASGEIKNVITVTGTAKVESKPDVAYLTLYVKGNGILMVDAVKKAKQKVDAIKKAIEEKHKGIKGLDVIDISIGEKRREYWNPDQKDEAPRPEVVKRMRITISPDTRLAYELIDTAIRAGAIMQIPSSVQYPGEIKSLVVYGLLNASKLEDLARKKALEKAEDRAKKTAALVGKKIGGVVSVGCRGSSFWNNQIYIMGREADFPVKHVGIDPNKIEISQNMTITYELLKE